MKLYFSPGACSLAPHIVFEWLKTPYELVLADKNDPAFKQINPMLAVPAVVTDSMGVLTQCGAILRHQIALPGGQVWGPDTQNAREVYEFDHWECFFTGDVHPCFFPYFGPQRYTTSSDADALAQVRAAAPGLVTRVFRVLDAHLSSRTFIVGDRLSIMDAYATPMLRWAKQGMPQVFEQFPHITRHYLMMCEDPGVQAAMAQQKIKP